MTDNPTPDDSGAGGHPGTPSPQPWDLAAQGAAAVGTDLRGALALFQEAIDLSAGAGPADPELRRLWAEVAIEVGLPDAQTRNVLDEVIAATAGDDDPTTLAFALGTLARLDHRAGDSHQAHAHLERSAALLEEAGHPESVVSTLTFRASVAMADGDRAAQTELLTQALATVEHHRDEAWADRWRRHLTATLHEQRAPWDELTVTPVPAARADAALARARRLSALGDVGGAQAAYRFGLKAMERDGASAGLRWRILLESGGFLSENADVIVGGHDLGATQMLEALAVARALGSNDMCVDAATDLIDVAPHVSGELRSRIDAEVEATAAELRHQDRPDTYAGLIRARVYGALSEGLTDEARTLVDELSELATSPNDRIWAAIYRAAVEAEADDLPAALSAMEDGRAALCTAVTDAGADGWSLWFDEAQTLSEGAANLAARLGDGESTRRWVDIGKAFASSANLADAVGALEGNDLGDRLAARLSSDRASLLTCTDLDHHLLVTVTRPDGGCDSRRIDTPVAVTSLIPQMAGSAAAIAARGRLIASLDGVGALIGTALAEALAHTSHLYVVADGPLWSLPWAAMPLDDGRVLGDAVSLSLIPSIGWLVAAPSGRSLATDSVLSVGAGDEDGFGPLARAASEIAALPWGRALLLTDEDAEPQAVLAALGDCDAAYIIAHGEVGDDADVLAAASIELADRARLDGRALADSPDRTAPIMVLNACYSGVMPRGRTDLPGGFWTGLLHGGTVSACITTAAVDPTPAHAMALDYLVRLRHRTTGPATALREAQQVLRNAGDPPESWACHTLVGVA
ncbi:CHAT domain-containing protein [Candidatus Microthrix sp.]|jgi:hypothetical protein|uniref:CHAT domain-containing protein n=1 Tax=Candidatus Neomicrothrix sp. TaxID=2719034 RepID=UPI001B729679|nr:CHAT domain-containing protein [Candidatus Microthrix sp.]MBK7018649.1 CHAT domain-containing protein [Candidatus Microthrix sp.]MBL0205767.1 CHAT domain-containing protein [Candidatus Microthrix sp.]MBP6133570.1 CHAT domain-containing protein [Candidatus Microthrix sp.]MBP6148573.1 CHAT domain-containing protein [Candidatus Microthrix sp.]MBP7985975.1 CHAT domain-containing protein [Candidatus Microthrix sp.]